jgi:hypothetical protein
MKAPAGVISFRIAPAFLSIVRKRCLALARSPGAGFRSHSRRRLTTSRASVPTLTVADWDTCVSVGGCVAAPD